jgi:hypothetical protein
MHKEIIDQIFPIKYSLVEQSSVTSYANTEMLVAVAVVVVVSIMTQGNESNASCTTPGKYMKMVMMKIDQYFNCIFRSVAVSFSIAVALFT